MRGTMPTSGRRWRQAEAVLPLDANGCIRLAIIADTHSRPHPDAAEHIARLEPAAILHAGDIGDLAVLDRFSKIAQVIAVRGNIDERAPGVPSPPDSVLIDLRRGAQSAFKLLLMHIAVHGPKLRVEAVRLAKAREAALVVCGHSHVPFAGRYAGLTVFNPGSIGPRRMHLPIVFGVLEISAGKLSLRHIDCETGQAWSPQLPGLHGA